MTLQRDSKSGLYCIYVDINVHFEGTVLKLLLSSDLELQANIGLGLEFSLLDFDSWHK